MPKTCMIFGGTRARSQAAREALAADHPPRAQLLSYREDRARRRGNDLRLGSRGPFHNFVADGFIVHNSVNEYSGRYSLMPMLFYTPSAEQLQTQSRSNNQGRSGTPVSPEQYRATVERWNEIRA